MTVFDPNPTNGHDREGDDDLLVRLRRWTAMADTTADELATRGGQERETATRHMDAAAKYDEQAVAARAKADELRQVIAIVEDLRWKTAGQSSERPAMDGAS